MLNIFDAHVKDFQKAASLLKRTSENCQVCVFRECTTRVSSESLYQECVHKLQDSPASTFCKSAPQKRLEARLDRAVLTGECHNSIGWTHGRFASPQHSQIATCITHIHVYVNTHACLKKNWTILQDTFENTLLMQALLLGNLVFIPQCGLKSFNWNGVWGTNCNQWKPLLDVPGIPE
jgi:hypothetical protein